MSNYKNSFLIESFESFVLLVFDFKNKIEKSIFFDIKDDEVVKKEKVLKMQNELYLFIKERYSQIYEKNGKIGVEIFNEVAYIMAAFADEIFLSFNWVGKIHWRSNLLEYKLFKTAIAGEKIFEKISDYLSEKSFENSELEIIYMYLLCLGFKGNQHNFQVLNKLKESLYYKIYENNSMVFKKNNVLFEKVFDNVFDQKEVVKFSSLKHWVLLAFSSFIFFLFFSHTVWHYETYRLHRIINISGVDL